MNENTEKNTKNDVKKELKETQQEMMIELKLKTGEFLKKFKEAQEKNRVKMDNI